MSAARWSATAGAPLRGELDVPGDKSVSHRAIMLASLADGTSRITGFLEGEDARATEAIFRRLGVSIETLAGGERVVHGVGIDGLHAADGPLDCGNAGTGMRLLAGLLAGQAFDSELVGDASLSKRPMRRVTEPLARMGARIDTGEGGVPPLRVHGGQRLAGIEYENALASAQVKSALLLAGLYADGETVIHEPRPTRDYTERMLAAFGWPIDFSPGLARLSGGHRLRATDVHVPADFSSAAFFLVAASIVPGSDLLLRRVGMNPRRTGLLHVLRLMGADIEASNAGEQGGEPVADLRVRHAPLRGIDVPEVHVPDMIDEFPALFVAAACADGPTRVTGAAELRVKESDRIAVMATGLRTLGIAIDEAPDGATIPGSAGAGAVFGGGEVESHGDHRIAMAFAVAAQRADGDVAICDTANVATSFPGFVPLARGAGFGLQGD
ncbi:3-phosphoshikimate 1-carboxyvinyltransferase [Luteimonas sp. S4-F44]|uniref:3-phosphoshikimate 1-carboxyvinyltransferase n=1 Tax=Luteimonas sp. S4-F44 TaxID=2925842 RepID=UPI001F5359E1|nr:3-phosphoshikimate 1-carboxyvinyltransferase [Luteimonas sp. S4-F44]UNK43881.1 3-phosphoshikimate 1-carboxyvinyltransferase [Luteimonas sp. S4-F44]